MRAAPLRIAVVSLLGSALICPAISAAKPPKAPRRHRLRARLLPLPAAISSPHRRQVGGKSPGRRGRRECRVLPGQHPVRNECDQNINVRVGLPLNSVDGGTGGVKARGTAARKASVAAAAREPAVNAPVNTGYVGSGSDAGHTGGDCEPGVNLDGTYNYQFINDFIRNGMKQQILLSKAVTNTYYAQEPGVQLLERLLDGRAAGLRARAGIAEGARRHSRQRAGDLLDALPDRDRCSDRSRCASSPGVRSRRQVDPGDGLRRSAACDGADGVVDGVIDDPRTCSFSAQANVCGTATAPAANCLTPAEALAIDKIWDGPRNAKGTKVWFGLDRGTNLVGPQRHQSVRARCHAVPLGTSTTARSTGRPCRSRSIPKLRRTARATSRT
jgi:hypothetical protein